MKKIMIFAMALMMTVAMNAQDAKKEKGPQDRPNREMRQGQGGQPGQGQFQADPEKRAERMAKVLDLTDKQKTELTELFKTQGEEMKAMREKRMNEASENRDANREEMKKLREKNDKSLEAIIGKEKMTKWQEIRQEQMRNRENNNNNKQ